VIAYHSASIPVPKDYREAAGWLLVGLVGWLIYRLGRRI
jgi:hypothetical protein